MKHKSVPKESKSLRTFYLYAAFVILIICISLVIKLFTLFLQSKFDGHNHFTIAITQDNVAKQIVSFTPDVPAIAILDITDKKNILYSSLAKEYGIAADAQLELKNNVSIQNDIGATLWAATIRYHMIHTDATIVDLLRLVLLSKDTIANNRVIRDIALSDNNPQNNTVIARAMNDPKLSAENVSIQIINASDTSGLGQRVGRILTNRGANVVDVSTAREPQSVSIIQYFGEKTYTLQEIQNLTGFQENELEKQTIANIVIILGKDSARSTRF